MRNFLSYCSLRLCLFAVLGAAAGNAQEQRNPLLTLQTIRTEAGQVQLYFQDQGTGATNYLVEFAPTANGGDWSNVTGTVLVDLSGGKYQVSAPHPGGPMGFYRVRGMGATGTTVSAGFSITTIEADEGSLAVATIVFSAPYFGTVRYSLSGTAEAGDYINLTGQVSVSGTTASIPIQLTDNRSLGQLKFLTLSLEPGSGYTLNGARNSTINIIENDAPWQGSLALAGGQASLGFTLLVLRSNHVHQAILRSDASGIFPTEGSAASITWGSQLFSARAESIRMPADSTLLNTPVDLTLLLEARSGMTNHFIESGRVQGEAVLITQFPSLPHLNTTNWGSFLLTRPAVEPSTNQTQLVASP